MSNPGTLENGNDGTPESAVEFNLNFKPETEDQFVEFVKWLKSREHQSIIKLHWILGKNIEEAGEAVYGQNTAGRIAAEVGISKSTVHKSRRFARDYSPEQVALLLNGQFSLSWRDITQNQSVPTEDFLRAFRDSSNPEQFRNAVTQLRRIRQRRNPAPREPRKTRAELVTENAELQSRVSTLETEKAELQARIKELERQQEVPVEQQRDSIEEPESAEDSPN